MRDEARKETARAADRKRLGRQNEVNVRRSQRLAITRGYVLKLPSKLPARHLCVVNHVCTSILISIHVQAFYKATAVKRYH